MVLLTKADVINFINEKTPHAQSIKVIEDEYGVVNITIYVPFIYGLFYGKTFNNFIESEISENMIYGIEAKVIVKY